MAAAVCCPPESWTVSRRAVSATAGVSRTQVSYRPDDRVFRRRRAVTLVVVALAAVAVLAVAGSMRPSLAGSGGGALTTTGSSGAVTLRPAVAHVHVVQPGETLWSIVQASGAQGDPRPVVDRLARQVGGHTLQVGQRLVLS